MYEEIGKALLDEINKGTTIVCGKDIDTRYYKITLMNKTMDWKVQFMVSVGDLENKTIPSEYFIHVFNTAIQKLESRQ